MKYIYLIGPIAGCDEGEAKDWREWVCAHLPIGVVGVSPLRCEPAINGKYDVPDSLASLDPCFGTSDAIASKNDYDVRTCDMALVSRGPVDPEVASDRK